MKKNFLLLLTSLTVIVAGCLSIGTQIKTPTVQAQQAYAVNKESMQMWEYCAIVDSYGMDDANRKRAEGIAKVGYFEQSGYREEIIKVQGETGGNQGGNVYETARRKAMAVAIAKLGSQGWEMVGEMPFARSYTTEEKDRTGLYFKRKKQ